MKKINLIAIVFSNLFFAQNFTKSDSLKGSNTEFRNFWDVNKYDISLNIDAENKYVSGKNIIHFKILRDINNPTFQIDLQRLMKFKIKANQFIRRIERKDDFIFIKSNQSFRKGEKFSIEIDFFGNPIAAKNAPWDGGWVFKNDAKGRAFTAVAQEGLGVSHWLPVKDIWSDEPDEGIVMKITTMDDKVGVGNGRLISKSKEKDYTTTYTWEVKNTINPYSISPSIGNYVNFKDVYDGEKGKLDLDYWVLDYNLDKAKHQFQQVKPMMKAFEKWFGPYPFYEDSYKIVEVPFLGMEHQSNVAYGNNYTNGYLGRDLSGTGVGLHWDFIIIHETGHEWFANNITAKDKADMWIHEAFTTYSEVIFVEETMGRKSANVYVQGIRQNIQNDKPIIGFYGVNKTGSYDMYYKGANMLHTIRTLMNDDEKFRQMLRGLNKDFYHKTVTTQEIEKYMIEKSGIDLSSIFNQYLRTTNIPILEYQQNGNELKFRYSNIVKDFKLPIKINDNQLINPTTEWQYVKLENFVPVNFDKNYYIEYKEMQ